MQVGVKKPKKLVFSVVAKRKQAVEQQFVAQKVPDEVAGVERATDVHLVEVLKQRQLRSDVVGEHQRKKVQQVEERMVCFQQVFGDKCDTQK